ncbi:MAG TPA: hypothetical protein PLJ04_03700 [Candidatus Saccharibacteria bacterium]|nr:hypothetical protein [Candidatus Saccharibacteria bacterium]
MSTIKGIDFFNIKTGETIYVRRPAQIKALIESSDMGVNRQSDVGWRLGKEWVHKLRQARTDRALMDKLTEKYGGDDVKDRDLLVSVYQRELKYENQVKKYEEVAPYEEEYLESIKPKAEVPQPTKTETAKSNK